LIQIKAAGRPIGLNFIMMEWSAAYQPDAAAVEQQLDAPEPAPEIRPG
jgi:hypothetical protein